MKILFCLLGEAGHINPYIGPAQALIEKGHEVLVSSPANISEQMQKSGIPFAKDLLAPEAMAPKGKDLIAMVEDKKQHRAMIEDFFLKGISGQVGPIKDYLAKEKPDAVIVDPMNYPAIIAAHLLNLPWISISSSLTSVIPDNLNSDVLDLLRLVAPIRERIFKEFSFSPKFRAIDCLSPLLNITFATEEFIGKTHDDISLVGPSLPLQKRGDEVSLKSLPADKTIIYVSFGSQVYYYPELFRKIQKACESLPVHLVMSIGELKNEEGWNDQDSTSYYSYAPQLEILKKASLFITHGGANSVMESLTAGVPMLISPICNDQDHQAYFVEKSGVGKKISLKDARAEDIRTYIQDLLENQTIKEKIKKVSKSYQANGSTKVAELITSTLAARR